MTYTDEIAIKALKNGDEKALIWIFNTYYPWLCIYADKFVECKETAKDIVQDLFTKLWENRMKIDITTSLKAYLYKGVYNNCLNHLSHLTIVQNHIEYTLTMADNDEGLQTSDCDDPLNILILQELEDKIEKAIETLPARCKEVFLLWEQGFSYEEIVEQLEVSINTVRTQITIAKKKLRDLLIDSKE